MTEESETYKVPQGHEPHRDWLVDWVHDLPNSKSTKVAAVPTSNAPKQALTIDSHLLYHRYRMRQMVDLVESWSTTTDEEATSCRCSIGWFRSRNASDKGIVAQSTF